MLYVHQKQNDNSELASHLLCRLKSVRQKLHQIKNDLNELQDQEVQQIINEQLTKMTKNTDTVKDNLKYYIDEIKKQRDWENECYENYYTVVLQDFEEKIENVENGIKKQENYIIKYEETVANWMQLCQK
jgi:hypothetical protein